MTRWFEAHTVRQFGRYRQVEPTVVVEVAFDVIQRSNRHQSGFALRFPRIVGLADRQERDGDRHAGDGRPPPSGPPARGRVPGHGRIETAPLEAGRHGLSRISPIAAPRRRAGHSGGTRAGYPAAMFGTFNPAQSLEVTVVTAELVIHGTIQTRLRRLTDVVNEPDAVHLILFEATFMEVGSRRIVAGPATSQVQLPDVLFIHTSGSTASGAEARTPKQAVPATLIVPPFTVEGQIHLPYELELHQALDAFGGRFVPVTGARYWAYGVSEPPNHVELLVVNRSRAHVAISRGVEWLKEDPNLGNAGSNPW